MSPTDAEAEKVESTTVPQKKTTDAINGAADVVESTRVTANKTLRVDLEV